VQPATFFNHAPLEMPVDVHGYEINLELRDDTATLTVAGDLDAAATNALRALLTCLEQVPDVVHVQADGVLGADLDAFDPLLDAARARRAKGRPGVRVESLSDAVCELFDVLRMPTRTPVELGAA
jgi:ABC-type transporter Mla MlaB component